MITDELQKRIESSAELSELRLRIADALTVNSENRYAIDPFLVLAIISIMIQVIQYCRQKRSDEEIARDIQSVHTLPPRKLMRFKRRTNVLWKQYCAERGVDPRTPNPVPEVLYKLGSTTHPCAIHALIHLAK